MAWKKTRQARLICPATSWVCKVSVSVVPRPRSVVWKARGVGCTPQKSDELIPKMSIFKQRYLFQTIILGIQPLVFGSVFSMSLPTWSCGKMGPPDFPKRWFLGPVVFFPGGPVGEILDIRNERWFRKCTLPETNIAPENRPLEKEISIGIHHL